MQQRATDYKTAQEVIVAVEMAKLGAGAALIERVTEFGPRWTRDIVRRFGGTLKRKPRNLLTFFYQNNFRLVHAYYAIVIFDRQPTHLSLGKQLLEAFKGYRLVARNPGLLDINDFAQIVDLYQRGRAWIRPCTECTKHHLVAMVLPRKQVAERVRCPICRFLARVTCRGCGAELGPDRGTKVYCESCSPRSVRRALMRKRHGAEVTVTIAHHDIVRGRASAVPSAVREPSTLSYSE